MKALGMVHEQADKINFITKHPDAVLKNKWQYCDVCLIVSVESVTLAFHSIRLTKDTIW